MFTDFTLTSNSLVLTREHSLALPDNNELTWFVLENNYNWNEIGEDKVKWYDNNEQNESEELLKFDDDKDSQDIFKTCTGDSTSINSKNDLENVIEKLKIETVVVDIVDVKNVKRIIKNKSTRNFKEGNKRQKIIEAKPMKEKKTYLIH